MVRRAAADAADELRRAPARAVGAPELVGLRRRRTARSPAFQKFLADGLTRTLVARAAREMSARTGGSILLQLLFDLTRAGGRADRVLDGPTSDVWIDPWAAHLEGAAASSSASARRSRASRWRAGASPARPSAGETVTADHYVAAVPVEMMRAARLAGAAGRRAAAQAARPARHALDERGACSTSTEDVPLVNGHAIYIDSEWALTSISQRSSGAAFDFGQLGDGSVGGILSVDVSDWSDAEPAARQDRHAVQPRGDPRRGLGAARRTTSRTSTACNVVLAFLDPAIEFPNPTRGRQPRAAAGQHRRLVGRPARRGDADPEPLPRLGLRAHPHRPGDDGGRQRGGAARGQRDPRRDRLAGAALRDLAAARAGRVRPRARRSTGCAGSSSTARPSRRCG